MKWLLTTITQLIFTLFMYGMASIFFGAALVPSIALFIKIWHTTYSFDLLPRFFCLGATIAAGYFIFGFTLILLVGGFRTIFFLRLKEGNRPLVSWEALKWAFISSLYLLIN